LGWLLPHYLSHGRGEPPTEEQQMALGLLPNKRYAYADMFRVKVTIELCLDKRGNPIARRVKRKGRRA